jgi:hypothetical protein
MVSALRQKAEQSNGSPSAEGIVAVEEASGAPVTSLPPASEKRSAKWRSYVQKITAFASSHKLLFAGSVMVALLALTSLFALIWALTQPASPRAPVASATPASAVEPIPYPLVFPPSAKAQASAASTSHMSVVAASSAAPAASAEPVRDLKAEKTAAVERAKMLSSGEVFGLDEDKNGVPDKLDRFIKRILDHPQVNEAAMEYYRVVLPMATKSRRDEVLSNFEKRAFYRLAECYLLRAKAAGLREPPNLNDRILLMSEEASERMQALFVAMQEVEYKVLGDVTLACE